jgi:hypothetical protein
LNFWMLTRYRFTIAVNPASGGISLILSRWWLPAVTCGCYGIMVKRQCAGNNCPGDQSTIHV